MGVFVRSCAALAVTCLFILAAHGVEHGSVATVRKEATDAAIAAMRSGGNAIDGAVAAALTLGVVDGNNSGIGGGCFMLIRLANGKVVALDGREMAPAAAKREMFLREGKAVPELSQTGALAVGVPGSLAVYDFALNHYGKNKIAQYLNAAAEIAEKGFPIDSSYFARLQSAAHDLNRFPASRAIFLQKDGTPRKIGETLVQSDLAKSFRAMAEQGIDWFYKGPFAKNLSAWMRENGGLITEADMAAYEVKVREPLHTQYHGYDIIGFPPPSSGGVHVAQILNILGGFELQKFTPGGIQEVHWVAEAMKLAFADRAFWLGDPDYVKVPRGLISQSYGKRLAKKMDPARASKVTSHGTPESAETEFFKQMSKHTTHFSVADSDGNWVACTATVNTTFGSKVVIPGTGIVLNNQMDDFAAQPGVPNFFGLVGAEANSVAPGKRPLSSMSPTIIVKEGKPILAVGAAGGPTIISQTLLTLINVLDHGMSLEEALARPRWHHQWMPDQLTIEKSADAELTASLKSRGHKVVVTDSIGATQAVGRSADGSLTAAHDPRVKTGSAISF